jgi:hypothetical protein
MGEADSVTDARVPTTLALRVWQVVKFLLVSAVSVGISFLLCIGTALALGGDGSANLSNSVVVLSDLIWSPRYLFDWLNWPNDQLFTACVVIWAIVLIVLFYLFQALVRLVIRKRGRS